MFTSSSIRARADVLLYDSKANWNLVDLSLTCSFPLIITSKSAIHGYKSGLENGTLRLFCSFTACYPNGTVTTMAVKVESVPSLEPSWLTLKDRSCKPEHSSDRFAFFTFTVDSCGTTRKVSNHYGFRELYWNV